MNDIQLFNFNDNQMRIIENDGMPYFVGKDVALILGYKDTSAALKKHIDNEDKRGGVLPTPKGKQKAFLINESGLYSLILSSKLPKAQEFKYWVTSKVLPTIRKTGKYEALSPKQIGGHSDILDLPLNSNKEENRADFISEYKEVTLYYNGFKLRITFFDCTFWFRLTELQDIFRYEKIKTLLQSTEIKYFRIKGYTGNPARFINLDALMKLFSYYPATKFLIWLQPFLNNKLKDSQKSLPFKQEEQNKIQKQCINLTEERIFKILKKYSYLSFRDVQAMKKILNKKKAKIFFSEVQTFCKKRSISINVFLDVICKVFIPELFID